MNGSIPKLVSFRSYQQNTCLHHQQLNRFSSHTWKHLLDRLKQEFPQGSKSIEYFQTVQNGLKLFFSFLGKESSPIVAQRAVRTYRIFQLHSKLWSYSCKSPVSKRALFSFVVLSFCQLNTSRPIEDSELLSHSEDLNYIRELTAATVVCSQCKDRLVIDKKISGVEYCNCPESPPSVYSRKIDGYTWVPFLETADLLIWRQPHPQYAGLYVYKVYGYYDDISAEDFLAAQLDINYRKQWDDTAQKLEVVEKDVETKTETIYWEMKWPKMFANRDYVFMRRHSVDPTRKDMVIMSRAVPHPSVPEIKGVHRVKEYWSVMHIKAPRDISQPGVEFGLTYFDNPGVSLPQWLTNWAAMTGIPDFLNKQRIAARELRKRNPPEKIIKPVVNSRQGSTQPPSPPSSPTSNRKRSPTKPTGAANNPTNSSEVSSNNDVPPDNSSKCTGNINSTNNSQSSTQQQKGKNELLSQFFKEQILDVHS